MTSAISSSTLIAISILISGLMGLEDVASSALNHIYGLATTNALMFFMASGAVILVFKRIHETSGFMDDYCASDADLDDGASVDDDGSESDSSMDHGWSHRSTTHSENHLRPESHPSSSSVSWGSNRPHISIPASARTSAGQPPKCSPPSTQEDPYNHQGRPVPLSVSLSSFESRASQIQHSQFTLPAAYLQAHCPNLMHSVPKHHRFAPISSLLSEYAQYLPRRPVTTPYRYMASIKRSRHGSSFVPPMEDARFPVVSGLTFPDAIPSATPLPQKALPRRARVN
ncbi:hypothetical protein MSAN_00462500 [Mycena sanguinolenta]|uniref:Uncharacterized protein n=1 Tax=Mycena sanguinolenta TaxID=230812 RepID=A0A8H7DIN7_9AGAR|nr:hypothetical protein MSAN_00462500 [Mycena sanguinolenta]